MTAAIIPLRGGVGVPPVPPGARAVTGAMGWPDQIALKRVGEMLRAEAGDTPCTAMAQAQVALAEACEHWSEGHMLAMAEALDVAAGHWRAARERA